MIAPFPRRAAGRPIPSSGTGHDERDRLSVIGGLAALSLDAMSSVAYGPEAIVIVLAVAGGAGLGYTVPVTLAIAAVVLVGVFRSRPVSVEHAAAQAHSLQTVGVLLLLRAFANGCAALTGVEAIANAVPSFRRPRVKRAQRAEVTLGALLGVMLI